MKRSLLAILLAASVLTGGGAAASWQQEPMSRDRAMAMQRVTLDQAVAIAQRQVPGGRVIGADTRSGRGRIIHEVRILEDSGMLRVVWVDAESGRVIR